MNFLHFTFGIWQLAIFITMNITKPFRQLTSGHWQLTSGNNEHHQIKTFKSGPKIKKMLLLVFTFRCLTTGNIQRKMTLWQLTTGSFSQNEQHQQQIYSMNFLHFTFGICQLATFITMNITKPFALATDIWPLATDIWPLAIDIWQ